MEKTDNRQQKNLVDVREILDDYLDTGKPVIPLRKGYKRPAYSGWKETDYTLEQLLEHDGNFGFRVTPEFLVIDVDVKDDKKGLESFEKLKSRVDSPLKININTPSGGFHVYVRIPDELRGFSVRVTGGLKKEYPGIDFLTTGRFVVIPPSYLIEDKAENQCEGHYTFTNIRTMSACKTGTAGLFNHLLAVDGGTYNPNHADGLTPAPKTVRIASKSKTKQSGKVAPKTAPTASQNDDTDADDDFDDIPLGIGLGTSYEKVKSVLEKIDPSCIYDEWKDVGMALHSWDIVEGLKLWDDWSKGCKEKYKEGLCARKWETFKVDGGLTLGTLFNIAKQYDPDVPEYSEELQTVFTKILDEIKQSKTQHIQKNIIPEILEHDFDDVKRSVLIKAIQEAFKRETGVLPGIKSIRDLFKPSQTQKPKWCNQWVYVNKEGGYFDFDSHLIFKEKAFNNECGVYVPEGENGSKPHASKYVADNGFIPTVDRMAYYPMTKEKIFVDGGITYANSFNPNTLGQTASKYTKSGKEAIDLIIRHLKMIMRKDEYFDYLIQWIAHNVQFMGKKITWSPCIQSIEGVGKTFILELMQAVMGSENVQPISPDDIKDKFNAWTYGKCVGVFEELRVSGQNRFEITDRIKPLITNRRINLHKKGVDSYSTFNTVNYICFTNHKDALPLNKTDRRWFVVYAPFNDVSELENYIGEKASSYFKKLYATIENHADEIRKWLLEYKITDDFKYTINAPITDEKEYMISTEEANHEGYGEAVDILRNSQPLYDDFVISSSDFFNKLETENPGLELNFHKKNGILKRLGFMKFPSKIWFSGSSRTFWTKQPMTADEIKTYIETRVKPSRYDFSKKVETADEINPDDYHFNK